MSGSGTDMDDARAQKVARAHMRASGQRGWYQSVFEACRTLFPSTDAWAVRGEPDEPLPIAFAAGDKALLRLEVRPAADEELVADVEVKRFALDEASVQVVERFVQGDFGHTAYRTWSFTLLSGDRFVFESRESLDDKEPDQLELLARGAAREAGWLSAAR